MEINNNSKSKRIAKNTFLLYVRMLFLMVISLYTSRVILDALGVEDFGIYNVVGGFVALFSIVSKSLSGAASRFLNFAMGTGNEDYVKKVFSTTVTIQIVIAIFVVFIAETFGIWFVNNVMVIPENRITAANWCFQLSVLTFCSNLITVPYNAAIIAHERMKAFAYVSIFEGILKLAISFLILLSPIDNLIFYAICLCILQLTIRCIYQLYCRKNFEECSYHFVYDQTFFFSILSYSGWGFVGAASGVLRNQGINVLINLFFGPSVNAARGISNQVLHAVDGFVNNFVTAVKPQITQSYAAKNYEYMNKLIFASAKFSFLLFLLLSMPIMLNAEFILSCWLKIIPSHCISFVRLILLYTLITTLSHPLSIAQAATGKIKDYQLIIGGLQLMNLPISFLLLRCGFPPESVLFVAIFIAFIVVFISIIMLKRLVQIDVAKFLYIVFRVFGVAIIAFMLTSGVYVFFPNGIFYSFFRILLSFVFTFFLILFLGCNSNERNFLFMKVKSIYFKIGK